MYEIEFKSPAKRFLKKIDRVTANKILDKIERLKDNPYLGKRLAGNLFGFWKLRIDKYRVIYSVIKDKLMIVIVDIGNRKNVYG